MSRTRNFIRREDGTVVETNQQAGAAEADLPWLEPAPDDFDDDAIEDQPLIPRKWLLIGSLLFLTLLAGVLYAIYKRASGNKVDSGPVVAAAASVDDPRIPLIEAPSTPVREKPENPGGMQVADTDKQVYDVVDGQVTEAPTQLAQGAEVPVERPVAPPPLPDASPIPDVAPVDPPQNILPPPEPAKKPVASRPPVEKPVAEKPPVAAKPVDKPADKPVAAPVPAVAASGGIYVQLGAFSSRERAEAAWSGLAGNPGLAGLSSDIQEAGPTKFRLRAGPIASRSAAEAACAKLKAAGQACLIVK